MLIAGNMYNRELGTSRHYFIGFDGTGRTTFLNQLKNMHPDALDASQLLTHSRVVMWKDGAESVYTVFRAVSESQVVNKTQGVIYTHANYYGMNPSATIFSYVRSRCRETQGRPIC